MQTYLPISEGDFVFRKGWLEVVVGGMFSGKTEELIRRLRRAEFARQKVQVFKPIIDDRYSAENVTSHNYNSIVSTPIHDILDLWDHLQNETQVVGIDEGQFFSHDLVGVAQTLAERGIRVIVAGLDTDWKGQPFEPMPTLMAIAENVTKQHAVCVVCGAPASRTQRIGQPNVETSQEQVLVGSQDSYEARCRDHFRPEVVPPVQTAESSRANQNWRGPNPFPESIP